MMALDRGGTCKGMLYRLPDDGLEAELHKLIRREMSMVPVRLPLALHRCRDDRRSGAGADASR